MTSMETKRAEFRRYLERSGVVEALTRALIALYTVQDKPEDPIAFVKNNLIENDSDPGGLVDQLEGALHRVHELEQELIQLQEEAGFPPDTNVSFAEEGSASEQELHEEKEPLSEEEANALQLKSALKKDKTEREEEVTTTDEKKPEDTDQTIPEEEEKAVTEEEKPTEDVEKPGPEGEEQAEEAPKAAADTASEEKLSAEKQAEETENQEVEEPQKPAEEPEKPAKEPEKPPEEPEKPPEEPEKPVEEPAKPPEEPEKPSEEPKVVEKPPEDLKEPEPEKVAEKEEPPSEPSQQEVINESTKPDQIADESSNLEDVDSKQMSTIEPSATETQPIEIDQKNKNGKDKKEES